MIGTQEPPVMIRILGIRCHHIIPQLVEIMWILTERKSLYTDLGGASHEKNEQLASPQPTLLEATITDSLVEEHRHIKSRLVRVQFFMQALGVVLYQTMQGTMGVDMRGIQENQEEIIYLTGVEKGTLTETNGRGQEEVVEEQEGMMS